VIERFERHRQPWTLEELEKLKLLARKGMALKAISKAMTRSEESIKTAPKEMVWESLSSVSVHTISAGSQSRRLLFVEHASSVLGGCR
jgi:hypothetical protein